MSCTSGTRGSYEGGDVSSPYFGGDETYNGGNVSGGYISSGLLDFQKYDGKGATFSTVIAVAYMAFYIIVMFVLLFHADATKFRVVGGFMVGFAVLALLRIGWTEKVATKKVSI